MAKAVNSMEKPPFDFAQAAFWLVACVIGSQILVVYAGLAVCIYYSDAIIAGTYKCDADDKLAEILAAALAAALGFAGGRMSK